MFVATLVVWTYTTVVATDPQNVICKGWVLLAGYPTLPLSTEDVIELTIYNGITQVDISNQAEVSDMAVAALSLLPKLGTMMLSGTQLSNLGMYVITTSSSLTRLDLSK